MSEKQPLLRRLAIKQWRWRIAAAIAAFFLFYIAFLLLGFLPVNRGYKIPPEADRVILFIRSNEIHTDIVMPVAHEATATDWRTLFDPKDCLSDVSGAEYVAIGWGNRGFFIEIETWADLRLPLLLKAIFPSESVLHVEYLDESFVGPEMRKIAISHDDYRKLTEFIRQSVGKIDERGFAQLATETSYNDRDRFYMAAGSYHAFNTCNQWTGRGLKLAGIPVGIWTPLKDQVLFWLPREESLAQTP